MKKILSLVCCIILVLSSRIETFAYNTFSGYKLTGGIANRLYYFSPRFANSRLASPCRTGFKNWYNTATKFNINETTDIGKSIIDCYVYNDPTANTIAYVEWYTNKGWVNGGKESGPKANWSWAIINFNFDKTNYIDTIVGGIATHEIGHVIGLAHNNNNKNSIMCQFVEGRTVIKPQTDDINGVNYLYKTK